MARRTNSEWLGIAGEWAGAVWIYTGALIFVVLVPSWVAIFVAQWTFRQGILALEIAMSKPRLDREQASAENRRLPPPSNLLPLKPRTLPPAASGTRGRRQ